MIILSIVHLIEKSMCVDNEPLAKLLRMLDVKIEPTRPMMKHNAVKPMLSKQYLVKMFDLSAPFNFLMAISLALFVVRDTLRLMKLSNVLGYLI